MSEEESQSVLQLEVEELRKEVKDFKDKYFRALAEQENARKRMQKERSEGTHYLVSDVISEFLQPLDQLEKALYFAEASSPEVKNWAVGFEMILAQFKDVLAGHNVKSFDAIGKPFDPHLHEAVEMVATDEHSEGTVIEEELKGYMIGDRPLRPARVKVAQATTKEGEENGEK